MDTVFPASLIAFLAIVVAVCISALLSPMYFRLAAKFFFKKKKLTALTVLGLIVSASIVTGSLAIGDSMEHGVVEGVYADLGGVDEVIHSDGLFNESIFAFTQDRIALTGLVDAVAPMMMVKGSVRSSGAGLVESNVNIIGYDNSLSSFGTFVGGDGLSRFLVPAPGQAIINEMLAGRLRAGVGGTLTVRTKTPGFSIESIYSSLSGDANFSVTVAAVVRDAGLGRFDLEGRGRIPQNVFLNLGFMQNRLSASHNINGIAVSNSGDERGGLGLTGRVTEELQEILDEAVGYRDVRFQVRAIDYVRIDNENVFFDAMYFDIVESAIGQVAGVENVSPLTSYFVNNISFGGNAIPYSTVTGLDPQVDYGFGPFVENGTGLSIVGGISDDEIIITNYTASRLGAGVGDIVTLNYTVYTATYAALHRTASFTVKHVVDVVGKARDPNIMPPFPGIVGTLSCADWDPPWIDGDRMRDEMTWEDLDYWVEFGGTPKAYITLRKAQELWSNDLGNLTTIKVKTSNPASIVSQLGDYLNASIIAGYAGIRVLTVKETGIQGAQGVQLLTETFLAFGMVVILSGIILTAAIVGMVMEGRRREIALLRTVGTGRRRVAQTFAFEGFLLSLISSAIGVLAGLLVAFVCIELTNAFWSNIVEGTRASLYFTLETMAVGYTVGFLVSFFAFTLLADWTSGAMIQAALRESESAAPAKKRNMAPVALVLLGVLVTLAYVLVDLDETIASLSGLVGPVLIILQIPAIFGKASRRRVAMAVTALAAIVYTVAFDVLFVTGSASTPFLLFFASGFVIVLACVVGLAASMRALAASFSRIFGYTGAGLSAIKLAFLSPSRRVRRTCMAISLFAIVTFTYLGLAVNIQGQQASLSDVMEHQGAGYDVLAESSIALRFDLGNKSDRARNNVTDFPANVTVAQFLTFGQIGGSCSNLRRNLPPRLIGANESFVRESTLRFQASMAGVAAPWALLDDVQEDGSIPTIGDYNTIVWILGKRVGDRLPIADERGVARDLLVVGIVENSIFPGSVFISEENINNLYPTTAKYRLFLFKTGDAHGLVKYLEDSLRTYGVDAVLVEELVKANLSVEWSYMGLFQALLLFGLIVGIVGLAASSSKSVEERKPEIGTMRALGFKRSTVRSVFLLENLYIASLGAAVGIVAGLLTAFAFFGRGSLLGYGAAIPWVAILLVIVVVDLTSLLATLAPVSRAARMHPVEALRREQ